MSREGSDAREPKTEATAGSIVATRLLASELKIDDKEASGSPGILVGSAPITPGAIEPDPTPAVG